MNAQPHIAILLATYKGAENLQEQLDSIAGQDYPNWSLFVSDDGSVDRTRDIVLDFARAGHDVTLLDGPRQGAAANFMSLVRRFPQIAPSDAWLAFCDQDDVWLPDKLSRAAQALLDQDPTRPALYCSRTLITDHELNGRRLSVPRPRPLGFRNALVQNVASGNTILLNRPATALVCASAQKTYEVVVHDWWVYLLISGVDGQFVHDDVPSLLYRQHHENEIGANDNFRAKLVRASMLLNGRFARWNKINIEALRPVANFLTPENRQLLEDFDRMRRVSRYEGLGLLRQMKLYRQTRISTAALWFAVALRRL